MMVSYIFLLLTLGNGGEMIQFDWHRFFMIFPNGWGLVRDGGEICLSQTFRKICFDFCNYHVTPGNSL